MPAMPRESEAKLKVPGLPAVRKALRAAGACFLQTVLHSDTYFDTPEGALRGADCGVRIRRQRVLRGRADEPPCRDLVTYKGPRLPNRRLKVRREVQTAVADAGVLAEILRACGLRATVTIRKRRSSYRLGRCRVELDELPKLGCFVEIEGPTQKAILAVQRKLGLKGPPILAPYVALLADMGK